MPVVVQDAGPFERLYSLPREIDFVICIGGRGGRKTYEVSKFATVEATIRKRRVGIFRDEETSIKETILNEILSRYDTANENGAFDGVYNKLQTGIQDRATGQMLVFTKGFRASSLEKRANLKGISEVDTAIVEEAEDIRSFEKFNTFRDSIRTQRRLIIVILNTPDIQHWIVKRYFNLENVDRVTLQDGSTVEVDGYWELIPKDVPGFTCIQTSYRDNQFLPQSVVDSYNAYGDPSSPLYDLHYYLTSILGYASSGRKGQVIKKAKAMKLADYMALPLREIFAIDFGTSSPAGVVGAKMDGNNYYARQLNYKPMSTLECGVFFARLGLTGRDIVIADSADPLSIGKLRRGWTVGELPDNYKKEFPAGIKGIANIFGVVKGPGSIEYGLGLLIGLNLFVCEESTDFWNEIYNYIYAENKEGEPTNIPIDGYNHLIDPWRYIPQSKGRFF